MLIAAIVVRRMFWYVADDVLVDATTLVARRGAAETQLALVDIVDVYAVSFAMREGIAICPRNRVPPFGEKIIFLPPRWKKMDGRQMDDLAGQLKAQLARGAG